MKVLKTVRQFSESLGICIAISTIPFLPRFVVLKLATIFGFIAYKFSRKLRLVACANVEVAFGDKKSQSEKEAIVRGSFRTFALVALDTFWFSRFTKRRISRLVEFDQFLDPYFQNRSTITVSCHMGNWEVLCQALALQGFPIVAIFTHLENAFVNSVLFNIRKKTGHIMVERKGAVRPMLKSLRAGGKIGVMLDQNTMPDEGGGYVDFFGLPVPVSRVADMFVEKTDAQVIVLWCVSIDGGKRYKAFAHKPLLFDDVKEDRNVTQQVTSLIEEAISEHPEQWLWMYKRWNYIPEDRSKDGYPFYSRKRSEPRKIF